MSRIKETEEYTELASLYNSGIDPIKREDISAALKGRSNISNHLREVLQNAEKEVIICTNAKEFVSKFKLFDQTIEKLNKGNIKVKIALSGEEDEIKQIEKKLNLKVKRVDIDAKFFIVDRREILFYVAKNESAQDAMAIWLNSDFFAEAFAGLFDKALGGKK